MTHRLGTWMLAYGVFLIAVGVVGFLSNPEKAATALISSGTFGTLSIAWGLLLRSGRAWARWAAASTTSFLTLVFLWRSAASWAAFRDGASEKLVAATLITAMLVASVVTLAVLAKGLRAPEEARAH
jgi:hypothetical protein